MVNIPVKALLFLLILFIPFSCGDKRYDHVIRIGDKVVCVEIADSDHKRTQGLSERKGLPKDCGMLFVFNVPERKEFWMYHCHFDIDIAYINTGGVIEEIVNMKKEPYDRPVHLLKKYPSKSYSILYALEVNSGFFEKNKIASGDIIEGLPSGVSDN
ncbi:DUF192 domain-containing protein [Spirochaetota bacterium]